MPTEPPPGSPSAGRVVLGLVPARAGSKGVPGKNMRLLGGEPLIAHTIKTARGAESLTRVLLSTESEVLAEIGRRYGADAPFLRPDELATDDASMVDVVRHALSWLREHEGYSPDIVVLLQPTVPFRTAEQIDGAVAILDAPGVDAVVSVTAVPAHHHPAWQVRVRDGLLERVAGGPLASIPKRRQDLDQTYTRDGAIYAFKPEAFWRTSSLFGDRTAAFIDDWPTVNIDTVEDWARAEALFADLNARGDRRGRR